MKTSSCGLDAFTMSSDAISTFCRFSFMLPLLSIMIPSDTGTSSRLKILIGCSMPFSKTLNSFCLRSVTSLPFLSATLIGKTTRRVSARKVTSSPEDGFDRRLSGLRASDAANKKEAAKETTEKAHNIQDGKKA